MKPPYVVKPVREGSSFGVVIVQEDQSHPPQVIGSTEWRYGDRGSWSSATSHGRELTCGVMGDQALGVTEIVPQGHGFYDYDSKYVKGGSKHVIPAQISPNIYQKIQTFALKAHQAIGCRGVSRSDFRYDDRFSEEGEIDLAGNQHPARHDPNLPGARNGRPCRPLVLVNFCVGWWRTLLVCGNGQKE